MCKLLVNGKHQKTEVLAGENGLPKQLTKALAERVLEAWVTLRCRQVGLQSCDCYIQ